MKVLDITTTQMKPTPWMSSLIYLHKANETLRVCLDPNALNKAIINEHHKVPISKDITLRLAGSISYSELDTKNGFWNINLKTNRL